MNVVVAVVVVANVVNVVVVAVVAATATVAGPKAHARLARAKVVLQRVQSGKDTSKSALGVAQLSPCLISPLALDVGSSHLPLCLGKAGLAGAQSAYDPPRRRVRRVVSGRHVDQFEKHTSSKLQETLDHILLPSILLLPSKLLPSMLLPSRLLPLSSDV